MTPNTAWWMWSPAAAAAVLGGHRDVVRLPPLARPGPAGGRTDVAGDVRVTKNVRMNAIRHHISGSRPGATTSKWRAKCTARKLTPTPSPDAASPDTLVDEMSRWQADRAVRAADAAPCVASVGVALAVGARVLAAFRRRPVPDRHRRLPDGRAGLAAMAGRCTPTARCSTPRRPGPALHLPAAGGDRLQPAGTGVAAGGQRGDHRDHLRAAGGVGLDRADPPGASPQNVARGGSASRTWLPPVVAGRRLWSH